MKKIVIIGASELQNPLILKAKEMGFETHVFAWQDGSIGEKTADFFYPISIVEKEEILKKCEIIKPDAVVTIASDLANITANYIARNLGLITNSERCIEISTNKYLMRSAFKKSGISCPSFCSVKKDDSYDDIYNMKLPIIVKPTDRSGSRSITKLDSFDELDAAISRATQDSFEDKAIVEEYINGDEYSFECISYNGIHHFLAVTKKYTTGTPNFIETAHVQPSDLSDCTVERVKSIIFKALDALEIRYGASHSEFMVDNEGNIHIIEIGSRMGGDCIGSDLVPLSTGYDFVKMVIEVAMGDKPCLERRVENNIGAAAIKYIFSENDLKFVENIKNEYPQYLYRCSDIDIKSSEIIDSSSRFGFFIVKSQNKKDLMNLLKL